MLLSDLCKRKGSGPAICRTIRTGSDGYVDADMLLKALALGFVIGFSVVGLSKAAIAALPAPDTAPAITQAAGAAHRDLDRHISRFTRALWQTVDIALEATPRLQ